MDTLKDYSKDVEQRSARQDKSNSRVGFRKLVEGQGLVEYALILMLVAIVVIAILILLGPQIGAMFSQVSKGIS